MTRTIQEAVAEKIAACGPTVTDTVVNKLSDAEISKRVEVIIKGISKQEQLEKELKKMDRPDSITYVEGTKKEAMSETRFNEVKKTKEKLEGLKNLIAECLEKNTTDLYQKLNGQIGGNKSEGTTDSQPEA